MLFKPELIEKIFARKKTQTRRPVKLNQRLLGDTIVHDYRFIPNRTYLKVGKTCAVCPGRGQKAVGRIKIDALRMEYVPNISLEDAKAEGFEDRRGFWRVWAAFYDDTAYKVIRDLKDDEQIKGYLETRPKIKYFAWAITFHLWVVYEKPLPLPETKEF